MIVYATSSCTRRNLRVHRVRDLRWKIIFARQIGCIEWSLTSHTNCQWNVIRERNDLRIRSTTAHSIGVHYGAMRPSNKNISFFFCFSVISFRMNQRSSAVDDMPFSLLADFSNASFHRDSITRNLSISAMLHTHTHIPAWRTQKRSGMEFQITLLPVIILNYAFLFIFIYFSL